MTYLILSPQIAQRQNRTTVLDGRVVSDYAPPMQPEDIQQIGDELAIRWDDGSESYFMLKALRRHCPCAGCKGEVDIMGNLYRGPDVALPPQAFELRRIVNVGGYAVQPVWRDGHASGIYSFDYLKRIATAPEQSSGPET